MSIQYSIKSAELEECKRQVELQNEEINRRKNECELLFKQLDTKVKNIEEERATVAIEMKYKEMEIQDLKDHLIKEREIIENMKENHSHVQVSDTQDRLEELCYERQKLFEDVVTLRRALDLREEQLHNSLQKNKRLERQITMQSNKSAGTFARALSPNAQSFGELNPNFTNKISKPIRGGGGNYSNFQKNNQIIDYTNDSLIKNRKSIEKISNQGRGIQSIIKDLFGGLLG